MNGRRQILVIRRLIKHSRERVFSALTDPAKMAQWYFGMKTGSAKVTSELRPGGSYMIQMSDGEHRCDPHGTYLEIIPPRRLVFTWSLKGRVAESRVTIELFARGTATEFVLKHELPADRTREHRQGWIHCVDHLAAFLGRATGTRPRTLNPVKESIAMATLKTRAGTKKHKVVSPTEWHAARKALLAEEKKVTRLHDRLKQRRRNLPWTKVDKDYVFDGPKGRESLADLFGGKAQLVVYHFMFDPTDAEGCPHCSFWADHFEGPRLHLPHRDTALVVISRAPLAKLERFKRRMGWKFKWVSSGRTDFNYDFGVSFTPEDVRAGRIVYNYARSDIPSEDREGISAFYRDRDGAIYRTYSTYARGIDRVNATYSFLDLTARGRDEDPEMAQDWVRYHDAYPAGR